MSVKILLFAQAASWVGKKKVEREISRPIRLAALLKWSELAPLKGKRRLIRFAINQEFATPQSWVKDGDEVAILPPMSGG